jgi:CheY-like chemotaxis protein
LLDAIVTALCEVPDKSASVAAAIQSHDSPKPLQILLAEDNEVNQKVAVRMLEKLGHEVHLCGNGRQTLELLERQSFDLVFMDVQMPELDGIQVTQRVRKKEQNSGRHLPIVAMTAHAMMGDRERCLASGMDDYVSKPIQAEELCRVVNALHERNATVAKKPPEMEYSGPPIDLEAALARLDGDRALFSEVGAMFIQDSFRQLAELRNAIDQADADKLTRTAHALKGSLGYFEAVPACAAAKKLEAMGSRRNLSGASETLFALEREMDRLRMAIAEIIPAKLPDARDNIEL